MLVIKIFIFSTAPYRNNSQSEDQFQLQIQNRADGLYWYMYQCLTKILLENEVCVSGQNPTFMFL